VHALVDAQLVKRFESVSHLEKVRSARGASVQEAVSKYRAYPDVLYAEPNYIVHAIQSLTIPNDPQFSQQWNLHNTGQNGGTAGADIHAPEAWSVTKGSTTVVLAIIDSESTTRTRTFLANLERLLIIYGHAHTGRRVHLSGGVAWIQRSGWKLRSADDLGHGTMLRESRARQRTRGGVAGINWNIQILPCKFINSQGSATWAER